MDPSRDPPIDLLSPASFSYPGSCGKAVRRPSKVIPPIRDSRRYWKSNRERCPVCELAGEKSSVRRLEPCEHIYDDDVSPPVLVAVRYRYRCSKGHEFPGSCAKALRGKDRE